MPSFDKASIENFIDSGSKCKYPLGLYLVATPIGNLEDITLRALATLSRADFIACEDTRVTKKLLSHYGIHKPLLIYNDAKGDPTGGKILAYLKEGKRIALVSDAGMPLISDPGYKLVQQAIAEDIYVTCIPGPSAGLAALLLSGLPSDSFSFQGFFPRKEKEALDLLGELQGSQTLIFYESPKRLEQTLKRLQESNAIQNMAVARELTKNFEQVIRGTPLEILGQLPGFPLKGELVLILRTKAQEFTQNDIDAHLIKALATQGVKGAVQDVMALTGLSKKQLYQRALELK
jgi:16S rRNA (cytidine1402-2'-O)-methyltransferase